MAVGFSVREVFGRAGLAPAGPVRWGEPVPESAPGVYVVAIVADPDTRAVPGRITVPNAVLDKWLWGQPVVYVGRTGRPLAKRLADFYRHRHGDKSPHRGGQDVLLLDCDRWVFWAPADDPAAAERTMLDAFAARAGELPFANRRR
ncbi:MAG: hypothetical protein F9K43_01815 [Bauldia sp.]|nr:MAG: hypothetical protein F9K43_01815 [Bauldia sp.]MBZ0229516.1 hypothetical protein [Bauldia sp.]